MHTSRNANELTIQETPGCLWFFGAFFAIIGGMLIYGTLGGFSNWNDVSRWELLLAFFIGMSVLGCGIWIVRDSPISKLVIDRIDEKVVLTRRGLFKRTEEIYAFEEIKSFCQIAEMDTEGDPIWYFGMELSDGEMIKITSIAIHSESFQQNFVFESNEFARKSLPFCETLIDLEESADESADFM